MFFKPELTAKKSHVTSPNGILNALLHFIEQEKLLNEILNMPQEHLGSIKCLYRSIKFIQLLCMPHTFFPIQKCYALWFNKFFFSCNL